MKKGDKIAVEEFLPEQHFTTPPPRFNDASLVKFLEESGLGRPSTYAPTIETLLRRYYISRSGKQIHPTVLGKIVNGIMKENFSSLVSIDFTAGMEEKLDKVESAETNWVEMIGEFFEPFKDQVELAEKNIEEMKGILDEETDEVCEKCGKMMMKKLGRFGFFLACSGFPECRNTRSIPLAKCPRPGCDGEIVARRTKGRGKEFYGCTRYPDCDFISHFKPIEATCPKCGQFMVEKYDKKNGSFKSCINPECDYLHTQDESTEKNAEEETDGTE